MTVWSPRVIAEYNRLLRSEKINPRLIGQKQFKNDAWPIFSRYNQLGTILSSPKNMQETIIIRMAIQYWSDAEATIFRSNGISKYMLYIYIDEWESGELPQPYIAFWWLDDNDHINQYEFIATNKENSCKSFSLVKRYVDLFEIGPSAAILETTRNPWGCRRILIDFNMDCHPMKRFLTTPVITS